MTLRFKITLFAMLIPMLAAVALVLVMSQGIRSTLESVGRQTDANQERIRAQSKEWQEALERRALIQVTEWIDSNLGGEEDFGISNITLPNATLFRSAVRVDASAIDDDRPLPPPNVLRGEQSIRLNETDRKNLREALRLWSEAAALAANPSPSGVTERPAVVVTDGWKYYWASQPPDRDRPQYVYRLELDAHPISPPDVAAITGLEEDLSDLATSAARTLLIATLLLILALVGGITWLITRPLEELVAASKRIATGDYSASIPARRGSDEIARMVAAYNRMLDDLRQYQDEMEQRVREATEQIRDQERSLLVAQRLAATGTLAAGLAHEINNPLGGMQNAVRRLRKGVEDPKGLEYCDLIDDGLRRIEALMQQILGFSRRRDSEPRAYDPAVPARSAVALVQWRFIDGAMLEHDIPSGLPKVFGDPDAMAQVVTNLLLNARDALKQDKGTVRLVLAADPSGVRLEVSDDGCGMDPTTVSRIFDPFFSTKETGKGTGLGLAIVHSVVDAHGGSTTVRSEPGVGTTFSILLPAAAPSGGGE